MYRFRGGYVGTLPYKSNIQIDRTVSWVDHHQTKAAGAHLISPNNCRFTSRHDKRKGRALSQAQPLPSQL